MHMRQNYPKTMIFLLLFRYLPELTGPKLSFTRSRRRDKPGEPIKSAHTFEIVLQISPHSLRKKWQLQGHLDKIPLYTPKIVCSIYPTQRYILKYIYSPTMHPTYIHPPNCWHDISNTNIYTQLTYIPQIVGSIYSIQIYISTNLYSPTLRPKGAQKLQQYMQPPSVGLIYPIPTYIFNWHLFPKLLAAFIQ